MNDIDWDIYLDQVAAAAGVTVPDRYREEVLAYLRLTRTVAQPMLDFELPEDAEPAPVFKP